MSEESLLKVEDPIYSVPILVFKIHPKGDKNARSPEYSVETHRRELIVDAPNENAAIQEAMNHEGYWQMYNSLPEEDRPTSGPFKLTGEKPTLVAEVCSLRLKSFFGTYLCAARKPGCGDCGIDIGGGTCEMIGEQYGGCPIGKNTCVESTFPGCLLDKETTYQKKAD